MTLRKVPSIPPEARLPSVEVVGPATRPLERFLPLEAASGLWVLVAAGVALLWANSPWGDTHAQFWHAPIALRVGGLQLERDLAWLINDGLMVLFFFVVGLELRDELSQPRRAVLPIAAALGGLVVPAFLYLLISGAPVLRSGWGVPGSTDLPLALGLLALLGPRVSGAFRGLLLTLVVISDLGASLVIALFASSGFSVGGLLIGVAGIGGLLLLQRLGVRQGAAYLGSGLITWAGLSLAGLHPTIAGVIVGLLVPTEAGLGARGFIWRLQRELKILQRSGEPQPSPHQLALSLREAGRIRRAAMSPAGGALELLHPLVAFGVLPLFALANAGVSLRGLSLEGPALQVTAGVALALVLGKPLGVLLGCAVVLALRLATLPAGLQARQLALLGAVAGVGFTMALFLGQLAFTEPHLLAATKLGILIGSTLAAALALGLSRWLFPSRQAGAEPGRAPPERAAPAAH